MKISNYISIKDQSERKIRKFRKSSLRQENKSLYLQKKPSKLNNMNNSSNIWYMMDIDLKIWLTVEITLKYWLKRAKGIMVRTKMKCVRLRSLSIYLTTSHRISIHSCRNILMRIKYYNSIRILNAEIWTQLIFITYMSITY